MVPNVALPLARRRLGDTYRSGSVLVVDLQVGHGLDDGHDGLDCVAVNNRSVLLTLIL